MSISSNVINIGKSPLPDQFFEPLSTSLLELTISSPTFMQTIQLSALKSLRSLNLLGCLDVNELIQTLSSLSSPLTAFTFDLTSDADVSHISERMSTVLN